MKDPILSDYVYMKCPEQPKFTDKSRFVTAQGWGGIGQESNCYWFGEQGDENVPKLIVVKVANSESLLMY